MPVDGCIELTGGVPERVRNLPMFLSEEQAHSGTHASDRLFFDLIRASQMGNIILVSLPSEASLKNEDGLPNRRTPEQAALKVKILFPNGFFLSRITLQTTICELKHSNTLKI